MILWWRSPKPKVGAESGHLAIHSAIAFLIFSWGSNLPTFQSSFQSNLYSLHLHINIIHYSTKRRLMDFLLSECEVESTALGGTNLNDLEGDASIWTTSHLSGALKFIVRTLLYIHQSAAFTYHRFGNSWSWGLRYQVLRQNWSFSCLARRRHKVRNGLLGASDTLNNFTLHGNWDCHSLSRIFASSSEELFVPYHFQPYSDKYLIIILGSMEMERNGASGLSMLTLHFFLLKPMHIYSLVRYIPSPPIEKVTSPGELTGHQMS